MTTVALVFGGRSGEHGISCVTAGGILREIDRERFDVLPIGVTHDGRFVRVTDDPDHWAIVEGKAPEVPHDGDEIIIQQPRVGSDRALVRTVAADGTLSDLAEVDVFFPLLHGPYGEDGTIQGFFDLFGVPYVGSGTMASAVGMDKDFTKRVLTKAGITVADGCVIREEAYATTEGRAEFEARVGRLAYPLFVKPARAGSSLGVTRVDAASELDAALRVAFAEDPKVLVESGISGREVECGVLSGMAGEAHRTTVPGEVVVGEDLDFYDYESKYFGKGTVTIDIPARIGDDNVAAVREVAAKVFTALELEGLARVDVFVTGDGDVVVNEVNTMPGFTQISMFPVLWENMGVSYTDLITTLIEHAARKRRGLR